VLTIEVTFTLAQANNDIVDKPEGGALCSFCCCRRLTVTARRSHQMMVIRERLVAQKTV
jgi:hypothetical protein